MSETKTRTRAEKPITALSIAKDALALLNAKTLSAESGTYFYIPGAGHEAQIQPFLLEKRPATPCNVCALGAVFCGLVKTINKETVGDAHQSQHMREVLGPYFPAQELHAIEQCFEQWNPYGDWRRERGLDSATDALRYILRNIIQGGGKFDPQRAVVVKKRTKL